jgi:D-aminoacyl-tRNA deacylase
MRNSRNGAAATNPRESAKIRAPKELGENAMKAVVQRVKSAVCVVEGEETGRIGPGLLVFLGVAKGDAEAELDYLVNKIINLRIFPDDEYKMNLSVLDKGYGMLVISQFTLLADCRKGNRPNFMDSAPPDEAERLYEEFLARAARHVPVARGRFGAMMDITAENAGPVTIILESK